MVDLVLDDLGRPAGEGLTLLLETLVLPADLDGLPPPGSAGAGEGQAPLLRLIGAGPFHDLRIEHDHIAALVVEGDDALVHADHVGGHADARLPVRGECVAQILRHGQMMLEFKGETAGMREMRKHVAWYTKGLPGSAKLREEINRVESYAELEDLLYRQL